MNPHRRTLRIAVPLTLLLTLTRVGVAETDAPKPLEPGAAPAPATEDASTVEARTAFLRGTELVRRAEWAEALASFETAARLKPHAVTTLNIGICERAMGEYTRARTSIAAAIEQNTRAGGEQLSGSLATQASGFLTELDGLLAHAQIHLEPPSANIAIDGRPLEALPITDLDASGKGVARAVAGTRPPGPAESAPASSFEVVLDPGVHLIELSRAGYAAAVVSRTFAPGAHVAVELLLDTLPATIHVRANHAGAVVTIDGSDVGTAPVEISRHQGTYHLVVKKHGFVTYDVHVPVTAGSSVDVEAHLDEDKPPLLTRWWFITGASVLLGGAALTTYFATRPEPQRPAPNGGSLGWSVQLN